MTQLEQKWIPLSEAAHRIGRSYAVMYRLLMLGELRAERRGTRWFVEQQDVDGLIVAEASATPAAVDDTGTQP